MTQLTLDSWHPGARPARARRTDHDSSHAAADRAERSGAIEAQMNRVLAAVRAHPGSTSAQLSALAGIDRHTVARRLPDLERRGLVTREKIAGEEIRWR